MARSRSAGLYSHVGLAWLSVSNRPAFRVIMQVRRRGLTYLGASALADIYASVRRMEAEHRPGVIVEAGCALGGSAIVMAAAKEANRPFFIHDTFEMIPPPSSHDDQEAHRRYHTIRSGQSQGINGNKYYGYEADLLERVEAEFNQGQFPLAANATHLVKGLFSDTLTRQLPIGFAHIDCDWHDSVRQCLTYIVPQLVPGGEIVIDDYFDWAGCRRAVDDYFSRQPQRYTWRNLSRLHILNTG